MGAGPLIRTLPQISATPISNYATSLLPHPISNYATSLVRHPGTPAPRHTHHPPSITNPRPGKPQARFKNFRHYDFRHLTIPHSLPSCHHGPRKPCLHRSVCHARRCRHSVCAERRPLSMNPSPRMRRPLRKNGTADCPACSGTETISRHNADWTCHVCHFVEVVDDPRKLPPGRWIYEDDLTVSPMTFNVSADQMVRTSTGNVLHLSKCVRHDKRPSLIWAGATISKT